MPLTIRPATGVSAQRLRDLILDNLDAILGDGARAWDDMPPVDECCLGAIDAQNDLILVSFDPTDATRALTTGLRCLDELTSELAARLLTPYRRPSRVLVLSPAPPPGSRALSRTGVVGWAGFRVLNVNGEFGLLLEPTAPSTGEPLSARETPAAANLNPEEEKFFQTL
jgi:hypothetical protein